MSVFPAAVRSRVQGALFREEVAIDGELRLELAEPASVQFLSSELDGLSLTPFVIPSHLDWRDPSAWSLWVRPTGKWSGGRTLSPLPPGRYRAGLRLHRSASRPIVWLPGEVTLDPGASEVIRISVADLSAAIVDLADVELPPGVKAASIYRGGASLLGSVTEYEERELILTSGPFKGGRISGEAGDQSMLVPFGSADMVALLAEQDLATQYRAKIWVDSGGMTFEKPWSSGLRRIRLEPLSSVKNATVKIEENSFGSSRLSTCDQEGVLRLRGLAGSVTFTVGQATATVQLPDPWQPQDETITVVLR